MGVGRRWLLLFADPQTAMNGKAKDRVPAIALFSAILGGAHRGVETDDPAHRRRRSLGRRQLGRHGIGVVARWSDLDANAVVLTETRVGNDCTGGRPHEAGEAARGKRVAVESDLAGDKTRLR